MSTTDLVAEYVAFKAAMMDGRRTMDDMTDREQAGMWIKIFGSNALAEFDGCMSGIQVRTNQWPTARSILEEALRSRGLP